MEKKNSKNPELLRDRTKEILSQQLESKREIQASAGIIIGFTPVFFTAFIYAIEKTSIIYQVFSLIPFIFLIIGIYKLTYVLKKHRIDIGYSEKKIESLLNLEFNDILLFETSANTKSISRNDTILIKIERTYNKSIKFIIYSIIGILIILFLSIFIPSINSIMKNTTNKKIVDKNIITSEVDSTKNKDSESGFILPDVDEEDIRSLNDENKIKEEDKSRPKK